MRHLILFAALLSACSCEPTLWRTEPPEPDVPADDPCPAYCEAVDRCFPEDSYPSCTEDCRVVLGDTEQQAVSGITPHFVICFAGASNCSDAAKCGAD